MGMPSEYVLRFISGKYEGGLYPLETDKEIIIGRSMDADMVLLEDTVSRRHARLVFQHDALFIEDANSTGGTYVNGARVTQRHRLKIGDRILIGSNIVELVHRTEVEPDRLPRKMRGPTHPPQPTSIMSGLIDEVPLPDLLQLCAASKKSGVLEVEAYGNQGKVYLAEGRVMFATVERQNLDPRQAFHSIMRWVSGKFVLNHAEHMSFPNPINASVNDLLMEGMV